MKNVLPLFFPYQKELKLCERKILYVIRTRNRIGGCGHFESQLWLRSKKGPEPLLKPLACVNCRFFGSVFIEPGSGSEDPGEEEHFLDGIVICKYSTVRWSPLERTHLVTLKALSSRIQRSTDMPSGGISCWLTSMNSRIELITTKKSNLKQK